MFLRFDELQFAFYLNKLIGGAFGFLTEGGPGASPFLYNSLLKTIPSDELWPINEYWNWHCGNQDGLFGSLKYFTPPLEDRYGNCYNAIEYTYKSQVASYESHRSMYEAYSKNKYIASTGIVILLIFQTQFKKVNCKIYLKLFKITVEFIGC